jgi:quercetin dioxygenase-like cupin family protein
MSPKILVCAVVTAAMTASATAARAQSPSSMLIGRATYDGPLKVKRSVPSDWKVAVDATPALDIAVQVIDFPPQSQSTWHTHPGPVFISVVSGRITFYEADCQPTIRSAGEGFLDTGSSPHLARNEDPLVPARNVVTYFAPEGAALRTDVPTPPDCGF